MMHSSIPEDHVKKILQALEIKASIEEKQKLSALNKETIIKLKETTLQSYTDYQSFKSKINMAMDLIDTFKD